MRKRGGWTLVAAASLGLAAHALAHDDDDEKPPKPTGWWSRLFERPSAKEELTKVIDAEEAKASRRLEAVEATQRRQEADSKQARDACLRREAVLDRIQQLAVESGDLKLNARIESLRERAFAVYQKSTRPAAQPAGEKGVKP